MMKILLLSLILGLSFSVGAAEWTKGEIRRIDLNAKKVTIRHQEIKSLDMPEMSMVFQVDNPAQLQDFSVNEKIEFIVEIRDKKYFAKELRKSN
jgi:Cu/Ag efflux protein CusF